MPRTNMISSSGDHCSDQISHLPEPEVILYPPQCIQLGWQDEQISVGSGLDNSGFICYINSTLQALFHIPAFTNWLTNDKEHKDTCRQQGSEFHKSCTVCMMSKTYKLSQKHTGSSFKASSITNHLPLISEYLSIYRQEDAHEFLRYLLQSMERCYFSVSDYDAYFLDNYSRETTPINQIFGGYIRTEVTCGVCGFISTTFQHFQDLSLDIKQSSTVNTALKKYFDKESLDGSYECQCCFQLSAADKKYSIERAPNVLCVQLNRYIVSFDGSGDNKQSKSIHINKQLDLSNYQFDHSKFKTDAQPLKYRLVSMVEHIGDSLNCGHYTALGLTPSGFFYNFNDSNVYRTNFKKYSKSKNSYVLFYELEPTEHTSKTSLECNVKTRNGDKKFPDQKKKKVKNNGVKRSFENDNEDVHKVVKKKKVDEHKHGIGKNGLNTSQTLKNQPNQFNGKIKRKNRSKNYKPYNKGYRYSENCGLTECKEPRYNNN